MRLKIKFKEYIFSWKINFLIPLFYLKKSSKKSSCSREEFLLLLGLTLTAINYWNNKITPSPIFIRKKLNTSIYFLRFCIFSIIAHWAFWENSTYNRKISQKWVGGHKSWFWGHWFGHAQIHWYANEILPLDDFPDFVCYR